MTGERIVFRTTFLAVVFSLVFTPNTALLCALWCEAHVESRYCEHQGEEAPGTGVAADVCADVAGPSAAFIRAEGDLRASSQVATIVPAFRFTLPRAAALSVKRPDQRPPRDARPLVTALLI